MRARVGFGDVAVPALADQVAVGIDHQRADRDFVVLSRCALSASAWRIQYWSSAGMVRTLDRAG